MAATSIGNVHCCRHTVF